MRSILSRLEAAERKEQLGELTEVLIIGLTRGPLIARVPKPAADNLARSQK